MKALPDEEGIETPYFESTFLHGFRYEGTP